MVWALSRDTETLTVTELFARSIRRNSEIRGITAPGPDRREVKCSLYMDDVTVFCADRRSIDTLAQTCEDFGQASGAKVNCGKSEVMLFGKWFLPSSAPIPFSVKTDFIKIHGVWFGAEGAALKSWEERLSKMRQKFGLWSLRELTIEGKTLVLPSEILSVLQYLAQAWPPRVNPCKAITRAVFHLIWSSKMDRVKRVVMFKEPLKGGKGVPDIATFLRLCFACNCIRRTLVDRTVDSGGNPMSRFFLLPLWWTLGWDKWDSSILYNWDTPWYYLDTFKFIKELGLHGVKPDLWKPKTIHKLRLFQASLQPLVKWSGGMFLQRDSPTGTKIWHGWQSKGGCHSGHSCMPETCADIGTAPFASSRRKLLCMFSGSVPLHRTC
ncbi:uncharacterized protein [Aquarana catesbeiana]|uniref:uncharacterized protein n=1 Tax=Aquarana catesbeiana TaxID=8400 RepID=UPI003CC951B5